MPKKEIGGHFGNGNCIKITKTHTQASVTRCNDSVSVSIARQISRKVEKIQPFRNDCELLSLTLESFRLSFTANAKPLTKFLVL